MKNLYILALLLLMSCSKSENDPKPTSIEGKWVFKSSSGTTSAEFEIVNMNNILTVSDSYGSFTVNGKTFAINFKNPLVLVDKNYPGKYNDITVQNSQNNSNDLIIFPYAEITSDYMQIKATQYIVASVVSQTTYTEDVVIKRK